MCRKTFLVASINSSSRNNEVSECNISLMKCIIFYRESSTHESGRHHILQHNRYFFMCTLFCFDFAINLWGVLSLLKGSCYGFWTNKKNKDCVNKYPTRCNYTQFILSVNYTTCFGWFLHLSSGAQIAVYTASDSGQPLLLTVAIVEERQVATTVD